MQYIRSKDICPESPTTPKKEHIWATDKGDDRFEICLWCGEVHYVAKEEDAN